MPPDTEDKWMRRIKFTAWGIGIIATLWISATTHLVLAKDFDAYKLTSEETMVLMQIDISEERLEREQKKSEDKKDQSKVDKLKRRLDRYETRLTVLDQAKKKK